MKAHGVITSIEEARKIIKQIRERRIPGTIGIGPYRQEYYRGQLSDNWNLKSNIVRALNNPSEVAEYERKLIDYFNKRIKEEEIQFRVFQHDNPKNFQNEWLCLSQAQHYGIPTRLLDWTLRPEVALYFAVDNSSFDDHDGQFWVSYVPGQEIRIDGGKPGVPPYYDILPADLKETWFINPSFYWFEEFDRATGEIRRSRQHGKFTIQPYHQCLFGLDEIPEFGEGYYKTPGMVIEKYLIPARFKPQLRLDLLSEGYNGEFLYVNTDPVIEKIKEECRSMLPKHA